MKKLKVSFIAVLAIILAIGGSAFTAPSVKPATTGWFLYQGGDVSNPANYIYSGATDPCSGTNQFCAFNGTAQNGNPTQPTQASLNSASSQSNGFTMIVSGVVDFKP